MTEVKVQYRNIPVEISEDPIPACPPNGNHKGDFLCVCCLRKRPGRLFGGYQAGEKLCRLCYPYSDADDVRCWLTFDRSHGTL